MRPALAALPLFWLVAIAVPAAATDRLELPQARLALLGGWQESDGTRVAGLEIDLADGWKTYWRSPGQAGLPPRLDWSGSGNIAAVEVQWPAPMAFDSFGIETIGYGGSVTLPLVLSPVNPAAPMTLDGVIEIGVCAEICIPIHARLTATWPAGATDAAATVRYFRERLPLSTAEAGITGPACGIRGAGEIRRFEARLPFDALPTGDPLVLVEGPSTAWFGAITTKRVGDTLVAEAEVRTFDPSAWIARDQLRLTLLWPDRAISIDACAAL
jgi:hypothetical protein